MKVELDRKGLKALVNGSEPYHSEFENPLVKKAGFEYDEQIYDSDGNEINVGDSVILRRDLNQSPTIRTVEYIIRRGYNKGQVRMVKDESYLWCHSRYLLKCIQ